MTPRVQGLISRLMPRHLKGLAGGPETDNRSRRLVFLIECLLNQNARDQGAAENPAVDRELLELLVEAGIGMVQIPCPEITCLGFQRKRLPGQSLRRALEAEQPADCCRDLAAVTAERIRAYRDQGYEVVAILGGNAQSPACAVHTTGGPDTGLTERSGIFMQALADELARRDIPIPFHGVHDADPDRMDRDLEWLHRRLDDDRHRSP